MTSTARFQIAYDGPALDSHEMDVNDLAPALLAVSELLEEANYVINGGQAKVNVKVKGNFQSGSFGVDFSIFQSTLDFLNLFNESHITGALNLVTLIGLTVTGTGAVVGGLIAVLKWLKGRPIEKVIKIDDNNVEIQTREESLKIDIQIFKLLTNFSVRRSIEKMVLPLKKEGIHRFYTKVENETAIEIRQEEVQYFNAPIPEDEVIEDTELTTNVQLVNVAFQESNKWRFSDGTASFYAAVEDTEFISRVQNNTETFAKNDILKVRLRRRQIESSIGLRTEYEILEVIEHRRPGQQLRLPIQEPPEIS